jgi:hypothetical protein
VGLFEVVVFYVEGDLAIEKEEHVQLELGTEGDGKPARAGFVGRLGA